MHKLKAFIFKKKMYYMFNQAFILRSYRVKKRSIITIDYLIFQSSFEKIPHFLFCPRFPRDLFLSVFFHVPSNLQH